MSEYFLPFCIKMYFIRFDVKLFSFCLLDGPDIIDDGNATISMNKAFQLNNQRRDNKRGF
ncbi:hypothetical protein EMLAB_10840 [Enterococcus mundtii]|nr:hypothetical protein EMLAB_10840 [Enterococcus mundtii]